MNDFEKEFKKMICRYDAQDDIKDGSEKYFYNIGMIRSLSSGLAVCIRSLFYNNEEVIDHNKKYLNSMLNEIIPMAEKRALEDLQQDNLKK